MNRTRFDVVVVGGGPTGMTSAIMCAQLGLKTALFAPQEDHTHSDARTTAIMMPGIELLRSLGVWDACTPKAAALKILRIIDDTGRLVHAPTVVFKASEIDESAFGYNIANVDLNAVLSDHVENHDRITSFNHTVSSLSYSADFATVIVSDGSELEAKLIVGADGVNSIVRRATDIGEKKWAYEQSACVLAFDHDRPHDNISTEFHTTAGPFTQVPLSGDRSSLVWVMKPADAEETARLPQEALCQRIEGGLQSTLGKVSNPTKPQIWPLSSMVATSFGKKRAVLIGQAAHAFPPIGAQGLNLGLRDVSDLRGVLIGNVDDPGKARNINAYDRARRADVYLRTGAVDALNRSLLNGFLPLQAGRAVGMGVLNTVRPLRTALMREGIAPGSGLKGMFKRRQAG